MPAYPRPFNSWDAAKLIGLALMFADHAGQFLFPSEAHWLRALGRGAAPIFLFLAGFAANYRPHRELIGLALILAVSDTLIRGHVGVQNILVTIVLARLFFRWFEKRGEIIARPHEWMIGGLVLSPLMTFTQYGYFGFLFALCGYVSRHRSHYWRGLPPLMIFLAAFAYAAYQLHFSAQPLSIALTVLTVACICALLVRFKVMPLDGKNIPGGLLAAGKAMSYYSGYIYVAHLIALQWLTGKPL